MEWQELFVSDEIIEDGLEYVKEEHYKDLKVDGDELTVTILGKKEYNVKLKYKEGSVVDMQCSCPYASSGMKCEHMAAACLLGEEIIKEEAKTPPKRSEIQYNIDVTSGDYSLLTEVNEYYCYALQQNGGIPLIKNIILKNLSKEDLEEAVLKIETDIELIVPYTEEIEVIPGEEEVCLSEVKIAVHGNFLAAVEETVKCNLCVKLLKGDDELIAAYSEITILPYNMWPGCVRYSPELLSAYIMPSHPEVKLILKRASSLLEEWTGDDSLTGYQDDEKRVIFVSKAVYTAIQEKNISYLTAPPSFEDQGQKIRFPDELMEFRMGNCMDMTLFYLACLEAAGLHGLYIMVSGHIFSGVWLTNDGNFENYYTKDSSKILKMSAEGVNELLLVDTVCMCNIITFEEAVANAKGHLIDSTHFHLAGDVYRARISGVKPIPYRVKNTDGYSLVFEDRDMSLLVGRDTIDFSAIDTSDIEKYKTPATKLIQWEHKLLDISTRNLLVNAKENKVITLAATSLNKIEDALADESEFVITPIFEEITEHIKNLGSKKPFGRIRNWNVFEKNKIIDQYSLILDKDIDNHILHAFFWDELWLKKELKKLYNTSKTLLEETGTNVMYLTLGMLRWKDDKKSKTNDKYNYAPIILVPVDIVDKSGSKGYIVKKRDSETVINMTLLELLKEQFNIVISGLDVLPDDEHGVDVNTVFAVIRKAIMNKNGWDVLECCTIGNYSFGQILMWDDVHSHPEFLENNKIVKSIISGTPEWNMAIPEIVDKEIPYLPVSVDASQMRAVNMAAHGVSFVLQGPPGTGKSQTITAMIANALMREKKVLFVAEKPAAMEVVQKRLKDIGLEDFCLEIHSNKATKRSVLNQIARNMSLNSLGVHTEYESKLRELSEKKDELDEYVKALHEPQHCGLSFRQLIDEYESMPEEDYGIRIPEDFLDNCDAETLKECRRLLDRLVTEGKRVGHPRENKFSYVGKGEYTQSLRKDLSDALYLFEEAAQKLSQLAESLSSKSVIEPPSTYQDWIKLLEFTRTTLAINDTLCEEANGLIEQFDMLQKADKRLNDLLEMPSYNPPEGWLGAKISRIIEIRNGGAELRDWMNYRYAEKKCAEAGLEVMCKEYRDGMDHDVLIPAFFRALYKALSWRAVIHSDVLNRFTGENFNDKIKAFKEADDEFIRITREEILYQLRLRTPSARASIATGKNGKLIAKAIKSGGRGISIRELFKQTLPTICTCCPCMLMSPLSVAQYLQPENDLFDLVIFDEASQLPTSKAVGVIARGRNAVIVGDSNQMPPTNFFSGKYEDMENFYELGDQESILDDCALFMPDTKLLWHYRSRHESLIAFSNRNYYKNELYTFPSVNDREKRVTLVKVNGRKKGNINVKEAQRVVEDVLHRYNDEELKKMSLGIVTFNLSQCRYIKKLIEAEYEKDKKFKDWATTGEEPLFVKNLENVQGDERDVILFSFTFAQNEGGGLYLSFGPLSQDGGWKRLNVAVSRAKYEMVVFSSITSSMIDQKHPASEGAKGLSAFLKYAETGILPETGNNQDDISKSQGIKKKLSDAIEKEGYKTKIDLGHSDFKIDIAVINPDNPNEYLLGIMLDGESYKMAGNTRDREIAQENVLKGLGWNLRRFWTMDWFDDPQREREVEDILEELKGLRVASKERLEHWDPESEEIVLEEVGPKPKKEKSNGDKISPIFTEERFNPRMPHTNSKEELMNSEIMSENENGKGN